MRWRELGEVENEYISHNFSLFAILCQKNYQNWWKFDEVLTKTILHSFFETRCIYSALETGKGKWSLLLLASCYGGIRCSTTTLCRESTACLITQATRQKHKRGQSHQLRNNWWLSFQERQTCGRSIAVFIAKFTMSRSCWTLSTNEGFLEQYAVLMRNINRFTADPVEALHFAILV